MKAIALLFFVLSVYLHLFSLADAQETAESLSGTQFTVSNISHYGVSRPIEGGRGPNDFKQQVYSRDFTTSVSGLPPGTYTIEIELAETFRTTPGRVMDITAGTTELAKNLDVFQAAGGANKIYKVTGTVDHTADSVGGPLQIHFVGTGTGPGTEAFFNAIYILGADGKVAASVSATDLVNPADQQASMVPTVTDPVIYNDPAYPIDQRIDDLIRRMSLNEKVRQLVNNAPAIDRLGIPSYGYWNEALHGVAFEGVATVFPQAIGLAGMWDTALEQQIGTAIGIEGRAKYNENVRHQQRGTCHGLTFWSPNINIFRDPRWGRGQETYGEDPFLTARMGVAFIRGVQGDDPTYMMAMACAKHFAVHSGPESLRHMFDAKISNDDLYNTYLPQFEAAVREGKVGGVMSAYNAVNGIPASADPLLLRDNLRQKWGFEGYVVSDCDAVSDIVSGHHWAPDLQTAAAKAVKGGTDLNCGNTYSALVKAVDRGLLTVTDVDLALHHTLWTRFRLGLFDPVDKVPFNQIPMSEVNSAAHQALALQAARESIVLLKNDGILPLDSAKIKSIAVVGMNATDTEMLHGNYNGSMSHPVSILQGIKDAVGPTVTVTSFRGCPLAMSKSDPFSENSPDFQQAVQGATDADAIIYVGGINSRLEGEEMNVSDVGFHGGDRTSIQLPEIQTKLLQALAATGKPVIFVNCSGSAMAMPWEVDHVPAIVQAWYPGELGGTAVADVLFGKYNPAGRLPVTFYASDDDLPAFTDYNMRNRTYRYFTGKPEYPFGFGLSYTKFDYRDLTVSPQVPATGTVQVNVTVANSGGRDGEEVMQVYYRNLHGFSGAPVRSLCGFQRVPVAHGETKTVALQIPAATFRHWDDGRNDYVVDPGDYEIQVGSFAGDVRLKGTVHVQ
jgi:beta-glucosidase